MEALEFVFDANQNRILKRNITNSATNEYTATRYVYDAGGTLMATYELDHSDPANFSRKLGAYQLYGSGRLGVLQVDRDLSIGGIPTDVTATNLRFEITDHLGSVRAVITGEKDVNGDATIIQLNDYFPGGMMMQGRIYSSEMYRFGYQGSEREQEYLKGQAYATFYRGLDPRIGRWLQPDPVFQPWQSPYTSMDCNPVLYIDRNGDIIGPGLNNFLSSGTDVSQVLNCSESFSNFISIFDDQNSNVELEFTYTTLDDSRLGQTGIKVVVMRDGIPKAVELTEDISPEEIIRFQILVEIENRSSNTEELVMIPHELDHVKSINDLILLYEQQKQSLDPNTALNNLRTYYEQFVQENEDVGHDVFEHSDHFRLSRNMGDVSKDIYDDIIDELQNNIRCVEQQNWSRYDCAINPDGQGSRYLGEVTLGNAFIYELNNQKTTYGNAGDSAPRYDKRYSCTPSTYDPRRSSCDDL